MRVTVDTLLADLRVIARDAMRENDGEDYVYDNPVVMSEFNCLYVHDNETEKPGCIFGQWLYRFGGMSIDELSVQEGNSIRDILTDPGNGFDIATPEVLLLASDIQSNQDDKVPWMKAISTAELEMRNSVRINYYGEKYAFFSGQYY
jgi:hypothetical protein